MINIHLPFKHERIVFDKKGRICKIEITIELADPEIYKPDGKKCVFRFIREIIHALNWLDAWNIFDTKMKEILNEA